MGEFLEFGLQKMLLGAMKTAHERVFRSNITAVRGAKGGTGIRTD